MFSKKCKIHLISQNNEKDYICPELDNQNPNFIFGLQDQMNSIENNNLSFNNNFVLSSLLNNNNSIDNETELYNIKYMFKPNIINIETELDNHKNQFILNTNNDEKELDNKNNQFKPIISDGKNYFLNLPSLNKNNQELFITDNIPIKNINSENQKSKKDLQSHKKKNW